MVSVHYDPLLAKLIVWAESRDAARRRAITALRSYAILGIRTNIPFLIQLLDHPDFVNASIDTGCLDREARGLAEATQRLPPAVLAARTNIAHKEPNRTRPWNHWNSWDPWNRPFVTLETIRVWLVSRH